MTYDLNRLNVSSLDKKQKGATPFTSIGLSRHIETSCKILKTSTATFGYATAVKLVGEENGVFIVDKCNNYSLSSTTTSGSNSISVASTSNLIVGSLISGAGIPVNSVITAISNATAFTINNNATASATVSLAISEVVYGFLMFNIIKDTYLAGEIISVLRKQEIMTMEASGSIPLNSDIMIVSTGDKIAVATSGQYVIGKNRQASATNGDLIDIELK